jgi:hypothetical protein
MQSLLSILIEKTPRVAQEAVQAARPRAGGGVFDAGSLLLLLTIGLARVALIYLHIRRKVVGQREREALAAEEFERRTRSEFAAASAKSAAPETPKAAPSPVRGSASWVVPARERLIQQLRQANLLLAEEGVCTLPGCPAESKLIRLRDQRMALIAPFTDSTEFLKNNYKRFDLVFLLLSENETRVLQRYQDFVAEVEW